MPLDKPFEDQCAILMCVYKNDDPVLFAQAIDSIFADQSTKLLIRLYLCVDGLIPAALEEVLRQKTGLFHKLLRNDANVGLARSLNKIIDNLSGEAFAARMDADDLCLPMRFERQVDFLKKNPEIGVVGGAMIEQLPDGSEQLRTYPARAVDCRSYLSRGSPLAHPTVMFRTALFSKGIRYPVVHQNEDIALWFDIIGQGIQVANLPMPLLRFRLSDATVGRRGKEKAYKEFQVYRAGLQRLGFPSWHLVFPVARLVFRVLLPPSVIAFLYKSTIRRQLLGGRAR